MTEQVTIVVVPRDRFSSVVECAKSIVAHTSEPFRFVFLDFGYSAKTLKRLKQAVGSVPTEIVAFGRTIPMTAFREYLGNIKTRYTAWVDNDTFVSPGWLTALLHRAAQGARVILPLTLERDGLDVDQRGIPLRNHISHSELRAVDVDGKTYLIDYKPYRRAAPDEIPAGPHTIDFFELHAFFAETEVLRMLDLPRMVVREHIDIGIQLHKLGIKIWCEPESQVHFDNIHTRPSFGDLRFFFFRWSSGFINDAHDLFEKRWGYRFFSEQYMCNWAVRRKVFSVCRFVGIPGFLANLASRGANKFICKEIPVKFRGDPLPRSRLVLHENAIRPESAVPA